MGEGAFGMWLNMNPNCWPEVSHVKEMLALTRLAPIREWAWMIDDHEAALVLREWPNGAITSYVVTRTEKTA